MRKYWDWRSSTFGLDKDKSPDIANAWESTLHELVSESGGKRALDVGTGMGQFAVYLARGGFDVTGIDISERMIANAEKYASNEGLNIDFRVGDAERLDFEDDAFDVVVARNLLWTLPHPEKALREWRRVIKPGGKLVVSDGFWMNTTWRRIHHLAYKVIKDKFQHGGVISLRFFLGYSGIQRRLPYYQGLKVTDATQLLKKAEFDGIGIYDTSFFHPYPDRGETKKRKHPPFFIAYAHKAYA